LFLTWMQAIVSTVGTGLSSARSRIPSLILTFRTRWGWRGRSRANVQHCNQHRKEF
jgi:hypothetical protein